MVRLCVDDVAQIEAPGHEQHPDNGHRKHDKKQQRDLDDRDDELDVAGQERAHGLASASGRDSIIMQKRPSVPLVNSVSCAERISPAATSYAAWPFLANCTRVASAPPVSRPANCTLYAGTALRISSNTAAGVL